MSVVSATGELTMQFYLRFLVVGLILGLFTEIELKLVAGIKPSAFVPALFLYPIIVSMAFVASRFIDRAVSSRWKGDLLHYIGAGIAGLAIEWILLGNGPASNAFQLGMFAMWTAFCFGPRILARDPIIGSPRARRFWIAFAIASTLLTIAVLVANGKPKVVVAVLGLSAAYIFWSLWLLRLAWISRHSTAGANASQA